MPEGAPTPALGERSGAPSGLSPSSLVMCNTPVEVQFTSAGCLNYPCRTPVVEVRRHCSYRSHVGRKASRLPNTTDLAHSRHQRRAVHVSDGTNVFTQSPSQSGTLFLFCWCCPMVRCEN